MKQKVKEINLDLDINDLNFTELVKFIYFFLK